MQAFHESCTATQLVAQLNCPIQGLTRALQYARRRFQPVYVPEPSVDETYEILLGLRERYEAHHKLRYTDDSLEAAAKLSHQYISDR